MVRCQGDITQATTQLQVVRVDIDEAVTLKDGYFLLRITISKKGVARCLIRHLSSGREVHIQSGKHFVTFIQDCLLENNEKP
jgi:hypothetical protein